ncbi:MAG: hypothetical protein ACI8UO_005942 [Verrucomicrobiales bacterium]|jgi:hypothetical protein
MIVGSESVDRAPRRLMTWVIRRRDLLVGGKDSGQVFMSVSKSPLGVLKPLA